MKVKYSRGLVGMLLFNVTACGAPDGAEESLGSMSAPITGGTLVPSAQHGAPDTSAIKIRWSGSGVTYDCSGVKNASNIYWTAGHCAETMPVGTTVQITNNLSGAFTGSSSYTRTVATVDVHPSRKNYVNTIQFNVRPDHADAARFTLNATTPNIPAYGTTDAAWVPGDQTVTYTGYGCDTDNPDNWGKKQYAFFDLVWSSQLQNIGLRPSYYWHNMADIGASPQGCDGDSGSPVWKKFGSTWKQIGIVVHGGFGYTGFTRYSNIRNWLTSPALNTFQVGFQGFLINHWTGRCITLGVGEMIESNCSPSDQDFDLQSFRLLNSGWTSDTFLLANGASPQHCIGVHTSSSPPRLEPQNCTDQGLVNYQRWSFLTIPNQPDYRKLYNPTLNLCAASEDPGSASLGVDGEGIILQPCTNLHPGWRYQAWMMTR